MCSTAECAAEIEGIHVDVLTAAIAVLPVPTGRSGQLEVVGGTVATGPLVHDIVDDGPFVLGGRGHRDCGGARDVEAVQEWVTGQDHVEQVAHGPPLVLVWNGLLSDH